jgi:hypothetical protein
MNDSTWTNPNGLGYKYGWCDTGYQNEAAMSDAHSLGWIYLYGLMDSSSGQTFTFNSMNAAASFSKGAVWDIISYTQKHGSLYVKAVDELKIGFTGKHVKMATLGSPGDFKNISAVGFQLVSYGKGGNTCTYGYPATGAQLAIGDVKVTFTGTPAAKHNVNPPMPYLLLHQPPPGAHPGALRHGDHLGADGGGGHHSVVPDGGGFHSHLHALDDPSGGGSQFALPPTDHFF